MSALRMDTWWDGTLRMKDTRPKTKDSRQKVGCDISAQKSLDFGLPLRFHSGQAAGSC